MSILGNIFSKIFPSSHAEKAPGASGTPAPGATAPAGAPVIASAAVALSNVDIEKQLDGMAAKSSEKLNWRTSIVDLLKLLSLDSSLAARKELAQELQYTGDPNDSASMNTWLHRQVLNKVAANGGKVPADLKD
jgi:hypothetical protein